MQDCKDGSGLQLFIKFDFVTCGQEINRIFTILAITCLFSSYFFIFSVVAIIFVSFYFEIMK